MRDERIAIVVVARVEHNYMGFLFTIYAIWAELKFQGGPWTTLATL
jgi:hypothetical protein